MGVRSWVWMLLILLGKIIVTRFSGDWTLTLRLDSRASRMARHTGVRDLISKGARTEDRYISNNAVFSHSSCNWTCIRERHNRGFDHSGVSPRTGHGCAVSGLHLEIRATRL